jgi:catechol 2,3-dioxygenase-like lactoylglutathione lyase family enzyme
MKPSWLLRLMSLIASIGCCALSAQADAPAAPHVSGIVKVAFYVHNADATRAFYHDFLGFDVDTAGSVTRVRIGQRQVVELIPSDSDDDRLADFALETDDAESLRTLLAARGVAVPTVVENHDSGDRIFKIMDPDGHVIEFLQPQRDGLGSQESSSPGISSRMTHVGILVSSLPTSLRFYRDALGLQEFWRGSNNGKTLSWVHMKVPNGREYLEFMLYARLLDPDKRGTQHHICLEVNDVAKASAILKSRKLPEGCKPPTELKTGVNGKRQINYYDPDGTRVELMEAQTVDGQPRPPSTAPAPTGGKSPLAELLHSPAAAGVPAPATQP